MSKPYVRFKDTSLRIDQIQIQGTDQRVTKAAVLALIKSDLKAGFFRLPVDVIKKKIETHLLWVEKVGVQRAWPSQLIINIEVHQPIARWGDRGIVNNKGKLVKVGISKVSDQLPVFICPESQIKLVWKQLMLYDAILQNTGQKIQRLELAQRGSWSLRLTNGLQLSLGNHETQPRLARFVKVYNQTLKKNQAAVAYVDMRYTTGMAVGWKTV